VEKINGLVIIAVCFVIAVLLTLGFINDCNLASRAELLGQRLDSVAERQDDVIKPIEISVRQDDILDAIDSLEANLYGQFFQLKLRLETMVGK